MHQSGRAWAGGNWKLELSILEERCTFYFMFISSGAQEIKNTIACNYNPQSQRAFITISCDPAPPFILTRIVTAADWLARSAGEAVASEDNRESAAILRLSSPTVLSHHPASSPSLHAGCSAIIICREPAAVNSAQIGNLATPQIK